MSTQGSVVSTSGISTSGISASGISASGISASGISASDKDTSRVGTSISAATDVTVLVSTSVHPLSGRPCTSRNDTLALEVARQLSRDSMRALHVGDPQDAALPEYLAFGARSVEVLPAAPGQDIVAPLAEQLRNAQLILCGTRAQSGEASGMLPYLLAAALKRPVLADVLEVELVGDGARATQFLPKGRRRTVTVSLPAIIVMHPLAAATPRYAFARRVAGRIETLTNTALADAGGPPTMSAIEASHGASSTPAASAPSAPHRTSSASAAPVESPTAATGVAASAPNAFPWTLETIERVPVKLKAPDRRSGHARMLAATASASRGGQVVTEGSNVEKAQVVLAYLREHDLIAL